METKTQKDISGKLICLKEALIRDRVSTKSLAAMLNDCIPYASVLGLKSDDLIQACNVAIRAFKVNGTKSFEGDDETREEICRIVFGIPLKNLRRKEERILPTNPAESAAFDEVKPTSSNADCTYSTQAAGKGGVQCSHLLYRRILRT